MAVHKAFLDALELFFVTRFELMTKEKKEKLSSKKYLGTQKSQ